VERLNLTLIYVALYECKRGAGVDKSLMPFRPGRLFLYGGA